MDVKWAISQLRNWLYLNERVPLPTEEVTPSRKTRRRGSEEEVANATNVARLIGESIWEEPPRWITKDLVMTMIWELTEGDHTRGRLGLNESEAPRISIDSLHPWVWDAARPHWQADNFGAAVWAASINVSSRLQQKVGRRDIDGGRLIAECFSLGPPELGRARLRRCDDSNRDLFKDLHSGALTFGQGLYSAVRNPLSHAPELDGHAGEIEHLEALASFSLLARWIDGAEVIRAESDPADRES